MLRARRTATLLAWRHARLYSRFAAALLATVGPLAFLTLAIAAAAQVVIPTQSITLGAAAVIIAMILVLDASARRTGAEYNYRAALLAGATP